MISFMNQRVNSGTTFSGSLPRTNITGRNINKYTLVNVMAYRVNNNPEEIGDPLWRKPDLHPLYLSHIPPVSLNRLLTSTRFPAYNPVTKTYLDLANPNSYINLTNLAVQAAPGSNDWTLDWTAPDNGDYELMVFWMHGTGHTSQPSITPSNANVTIDYMSGKGVDALIEYWENTILTPELVDVIKDNGRCQLYMDSLELSSSAAKGNHYWCSSFLDEFETRRGYDLTPYLPFIVRTTDRTVEYYYEVGGELQGAIDKVRLDLYQTLTELYSHNTLEPLQEWLHSMNMTLRCENSYCQTFEITYPMQYIDSVETESYEFMDQIESFRNMSGGTHVYNKVLSSESGAQYSRYSTSFDRLLNMMYAQFAAGISRTVVHGYSLESGPTLAEAAWPGHENTYAIFTPRVPYWRDSMDINTQIARLQKILRDGKSRMDVGILRYDYQLWSYNDQTFYDAMEEEYGFYWTDLTLQRAGYTYDYFSPEVLQHNEYAFLNDDKTFGNAAYQALVLYQEWLPYESAQALLELAKNGLPVVIVSGDSIDYQWGKIFKTHKGGATQTPSFDGNDAQLAAVMAEIKELDNVKVIPSQADAYDALINLGVRPRAEFTKPSGKLYTVTRDWDDKRFLYVYNYKFDKFDEGDRYTGDIIVDGEYIPYIYDPWTGDVTRIGNYTVDANGNTVLTVSLNPGGMKVFALDPKEDEKLHAVSSDADSLYYSGDNLIMRASQSGEYTSLLNNSDIVKTSVTVPENIPLPLWDLTVESWERTTGDDYITYTEDRGLGYISTEYEYPTIKNNINVGQTELISWRNIQALRRTSGSTVTSVSGVGSYTTSFTLPTNWNAGNTAIFKAESLGGSTARVYVNGVKADAVDIFDVNLDITDLVHPGENTIEVQIATGLTNYRLGINQASGGASDIGGPYDYGMLGEAAIVTYTNAVVIPNVLAYIRTDEASVGVNSPTSYTISLSNAQGAGVVTLSFTTDSRYLDLYNATALNSFSIIDPLTWEYIGGQVWRGTVKLYCPGFVQSSAPIDILNISGMALDLLGDTTVTLTGITVTGDMYGFSGDMPSVIMTAEAATSIVSKTVFSKYDLNHDGRIDELDLAIVVYYYLANDLEADWDVVKFDIASAKDCDVALNGRVDLADMIEVIANYCDSY